MAVPKIVADFTTQLAAAIAIGETSTSIVDNVDDDGVTLVDGSYYFTIDGDNNRKEHISCTKTGVNLTSIKTVSRQGIETSGVTIAHRIGAVVTMTDWATYKTYIDQATLAGVVPATTSTLGGVYTTTNTASSVVVSTDDSRMPTADEKEAMVGSGSTPASTNKFVTADTNALNELLANKDTDGTLAANSDTKYPSQKATKTYVDAYAPTKKCGVITRDMNAVSGTVNTAHGLGRTPKIVRASFITSFGSNTSSCWGAGAYDGTTNCCVYYYSAEGTPGTTTAASNTSYAIYVTQPGAGVVQKGAITVDGTNIIIAWSQDVDPGVAMNLFVNWEVE